VSAVLGICGGTGFRVPDPEAYNEPVTWRNKWLEDHPGGTVGRPGTDHPLEVSVDGTVLAVAYTMGILMERARRAEAEGRCPRHPVPQDDDGTAES
jgi:hypothetical protein